MNPQPGKTPTLTPSAQPPGFRKKRKKASSSPDVIAAANEKRRQTMKGRAVRKGVLSDAEWERRFQKYIDPDYYSQDDRTRGSLGSTLSGITYGVATKSRKQNGAQ